MADGSIRVNTKLDTKPAQADLKKLEKECEKTAQKIEQVGIKIKTVFTGASKGQLNSAFKTANRELEKTEKALAAVESKIAEIQAETDKMLPFAATDEQTVNILAIEELETAPLVKQRDELTAKAAEYKRQMEAITAELNAQANAEAAQAALKTDAKDAVADAEWLGKIKNEQEYNALLDQTNAKMAVIEQEAARIAQQTGVPVSQLLEQNGQYQTLVRRAALLAANQGKFKGKVSDSTAAMMSLEKTAVKAGHKITTSLNQGIKRLSRMTVGLLGARSAFMVLRRAASTYMEANEQLKYQVEGLWNVLAVAIGPVVQQLVSWLTIAISYINALVKALWGVDLVAKANAMSIKKQAKATADAAKASKQLAGFDEMNKLNDTSSGSAAGAEAGAGQFKPSPVSQKALDDFISKLNTILPLVTGIAAGLAAWKILSTFGAPLKICAAAFLAISGAVTAIMSFLKMLDGGIEWGELGTFVAGIIALATGLGLAFNGVTAAISVVVGGIMAIVAGFKDWLENGKSLEALTAIEIGLLAVATAIGVILFICIEAVAWWAILIAAAVGLVLGAVVAIVMYWEEVKAAAKTVWEWVEKNILAKLADFFKPLTNSAKSAWDWVNKKLFTPIKNFFKDVKDAVNEVVSHAVKKVKEIVSGVTKAITSITSKIKEIYNKIKEIFQALWEAFKKYVWKPITDKLKAFYTSKIKPIIDEIKKVFKNVGSWVQKKIINPIVTKFNALKTKIISIITSVKNKAISLFKTIGKTVVNFISGLLKATINGVLAGIETSINNFIGLLNGAIKLINKIPGVNITKVEKLEIPRLAKGGIVNNPGRGVPVIAGEAGAEAVLPLENNTGWMDILAEKINGGASQILIPIYLNGRKIAEEVIDITQKRKFATNGAF